MPSSLILAVSDPSPATDRCAGDMPKAGWNPTSMVASTLIPARKVRSGFGTVTSTSKVRAVELVIEAIRETIPARLPAPATSTLT